jgi:hypothetical protein
MARPMKSNPYDFALGVQRGTGRALRDLSVASRARSLTITATHELDRITAASPTLYLAFELR